MGRVAVVDDHELVAEALRLALTGAGFDAVAVPPRAMAELLVELRVMQPALVVLDLDLGPLGDSSGLIAPLVADGIRVLVLTGSTDRPRIAAALERGALGYQPKSLGLAGLVAKTRAAIDTDGPLDLEERGRLLDELARSRAEQDRVFGPFRLLTDREQDTLCALGRGISVHDIADEWVLSEATVRTHVRGILAKLNASSQLAAVTSAMRTGWFAESNGTSRGR